VLEQTADIEDIFITSVRIYNEDKTKELV
jgi:hypothetical protein